MLFNKSILFNADGSGNVSQNTNVLGQEVGIVGEYGISKNPESFAIYGNIIWHTDEYRGCVLALTPSDTYEEISDRGMRDYFRDHFRENIGNYRFASYDPYHDQYTLHLSDRLQPQPTPEILCDTVLSKINVTEPYSYQVTFDDLTGDTNIDYSISTGSITITVVWGTETFVSTTLIGDGTFSFVKSTKLPREATVTVTPITSPTTHDITTMCSVGVPLKIVYIVLGDSVDVGKTVNNRYRWGASTLFNTVDVFDDAGVIRFEESNGFEGVGKFPIRGSEITLQSYRDSFSQVEFDVEEFDRLGFWISALEITEIEVELILAQATFPTITNNNDGDIPETNSITFPFNKTADEILYLIWDYTDRRPILLCEDTLNASGSNGIYEVPINVGIGVGMTGINYDAFGIPDRFEILYNGIVVADSRYVGDDLSSMNPTGTYTLSVFKFIGTDDTGTALFDDGSTEQRVITVGSGDIADGITRPTQGEGNLLFNKLTANPQVITVRVTGVFSSTGWDFTGICPNAPIPPL